MIRANLAYILRAECKAARDDAGLIQHLYIWLLGYLLALVQAECVELVFDLIFFHSENVKMNVASYFWFLLVKKVRRVTQI
jgi:hypothetical protein